MTGGSRVVKGALGGLEKKADALMVVVEPVENGQENGARTLAVYAVDVQPVAPTIADSEPASGVDQP